MENRTTKSFPVVGMHCASCANTIKTSLKKIDGIESCEVNVGTEKAKISFDKSKVDVGVMNKTLGKFGYSLVDEESEDMNNSGHNMTMMDHSKHDMSKMGHDMSLMNQGDKSDLHAGHNMSVENSDEESVNRKQLEIQKMFEKVSFVMPIVVVTFIIMFWELLAHYVKGFVEFPMTMMESGWLLFALATPVLFWVGKQFIEGIWHFLAHRVANMDTLVGIGTMVAYVYSALILLSPWFATNYSFEGGMYFDVTIVVIGFIILGKYMEMVSKQKTGEAVRALVGLQAKTAEVVRNGKAIEISVDEVIVGDIVVVRPGGKVPVDGVVIDGSTSIDESSISGESMPVDKKNGDKVIAATINKQGFIKIRAQKIGKDTMLSQIIRMVEEAQGSKAPIERLADQVSAIFVPTVLILAVVVLLGWILIGSNFMPFSQALALGIVSTVGVLVIACPCAMGLATPTAVIVGVGRAASMGILIKNAESLEKFAGVNFVAFDKTGTLTNGRPVVTEVVSYGIEQSRLISLLYSLEAKSEHPIATAIIEKAKESAVKKIKVINFSAVEGKGVDGKIGTTVYMAGSRKMFGKEVLEQDKIEMIEKWESEGKTVVILGTTKKILGLVAVADTIKSEAVSTISSLHQLGVKTAMITGDNPRTANFIASQLGIDRTIADVMPADKAAKVKELQDEGYRVAMVGDGVNDAPALALADVGVAMGTGTDVAIESAGVTLLSGKIEKLPLALSLSRETMKIIKQNLFWAFFYNVMGIPLAAGLLYPFFGILLSPAVAGGAMAFSSVSVVINSLRLKNKKI